MDSLEESVLSPPHSRLGFSTICPPVLSPPPLRSFRPLRRITTISTNHNDTLSEKGYHGTFDNDTSPSSPLRRPVKKGESQHELDDDDDDDTFRFFSLLAGQSFFSFCSFASVASPLYQKKGGGSSLEEAFFVVRSCWLVLLCSCLILLFV